MRDTVRHSFKNNPLGSVALAVLIVGMVLLVGQGYQNRQENWQRDYNFCLETVANRAQSAVKTRKEAERELYLAGRTRGKVSELHMQSADESTLLAIALESTSAPTDDRQQAYCHRVNPKPGLFK